MKDKLGITMRTFGSPGNMNDTNTALVIARTEDIKVWFYVPRGVPVPDNVIAIPRTSIEWNGPKAGMLIRSDSSRNTIPTSR